MSSESIWNMEIKTPNGLDTPTFHFTIEGDTLIGYAEGGSMMKGRIDFTEGKVEDGKLIWKMITQVPRTSRLDCKAKIEGDEIYGIASMGILGKIKFTGTRAS